VLIGDVALQQGDPRSHYCTVVSGGYGTLLG
jgi:hypothetical protein